MSDKIKHSFLKAMKRSFDEADSAFIKKVETEEAERNAQRELVQRMLGYVQDLIEAIPEPFQASLVKAEEHIELHVTLRPESSLYMSMMSRGRLWPRPANLLWRATIHPKGQWASGYEFYVQVHSPAALRDEYRDVYRRKTVPHSPERAVQLLAELLGLVLGEKEAYFKSHGLE